MLGPILPSKLRVALLTPHQAKRTSARVLPSLRLQHQRRSPPQKMSRGRTRWWRRLRRSGTGASATHRSLWSCWRLASSALSGQELSKVPVPPFPLGSLPRSDVGDEEVEPISIGERHRGARLLYRPSNYVIARRTSASQRWCSCALGPRRRSGLRRHFSGRAGTSSRIIARQIHRDPR